MTVSLKHEFHSPKTDGPDSTVVQPSDWNADHVLTMGAGKVLGRTTGTTGAVQELPLAFDSNMQSMVPPSGTTSQRPATPVAGMMRYNTSTSQLEMYRNGIWGSIGGGAYVGATAPSNPQSGDFWYNSITGQLTTFDGSVWALSTVTQNVVTFTGDGFTTTYALGIDPGSKNNTAVYLSGVYQQKSTYSLSGSSLTFSSAPPVGVSIEVMLLSSTTVGVPSDGSVSTVKIVDAAVSTAKMADASVSTAKLANLAVTGAKVANSTIGFTKLDPADVVTSSETIGSNISNSKIPTTAAVDSYIPDKMNATGSAPMFACRAWVNFGYVSSAVVVRNSGNVSSVVRNGVGDYTINFTTAMPDADYCAVAVTGFTDGTYATVVAQTASSVRVHAPTRGSSIADIDIMNVAIIR